MITYGVDATIVVTQDIASKNTYTQCDNPVRLNTPLFKSCQLLPSRLDSKGIIVPFPHTYCQCLHHNILTDGCKASLVNSQKQLNSMKLHTDSSAPHPACIRMPNALRPGRL